MCILIKNLLSSLCIREDRGKGPLQRLLFHMFLQLFVLQKQIFIAVTTVSTL